MMDSANTKPDDAIKSIDTDTVLKHAGDFHKFQAILMALFSVINVLSAYHYFGQTFVGITPATFECERWKDIENCSNSTFTDQTMTVESVTTTTTAAVASQATSCFRTIQLNDTQTFHQQQCSEWRYNNSYEYISIVQELNWICAEDWKPAVGQSVFFVGSVLASIAFGVLADRIGRLHVLVAANMFACLGNVLTATATNVLQYSIYRFIAGCATDTNFIMMYIIVMEYIRPSMRTAGLNMIIGVFYCIGSLCVPWTAVLTGRWSYFLLAVGLPHLSVLGFYFAVPESAQWLLSIGRVEAAVKGYQYIAKINGRHITDPVLEGLRKYAKDNILTPATTEVSPNENETVQHESFLGLLRTPHMRKKTLLLIFKSMVMTLCFDGIARNVQGLSYSPFFVFTVTSATILPACGLVVAVQDRIGRKALASGALLACGLLLLSSGILLACQKRAIAIGVDQDDADNSTYLVTLILTILARFAIVLAYNAGHQYAVELIPVQVRGQGVSVLHVAGFVASSVSPQILYLGGWWRPAPDFILATLLVLGACACLFLPETLNKTLPVTLADGERFGQGEGIFEHVFYRSRFGESTHILTNASSNVTISTDKC